MISSEHFELNTLKGDLQVKSRPRYNPSYSYCAGLKIAVGHRTMTDGEDLMTGNFFSLSDVLSDGESR